MLWQVANSVKVHLKKERTWFKRGWSTYTILWSIFDFFRYHDYHQYRHTPNSQQHAKFHMKEQKKSSKKQTCIIFNLPKMCVIWVKWVKCNNLVFISTNWINEKTSSIVFFLQLSTRPNKWRNRRWGVKERSEFIRGSGCCHLFRR